MQRLLVPPPDLRDPGDPEATRRHRASLAEMLSRDPGASDPGGAPASAAASPDLFGRPDPEAQARIDARLEADVRQMRRRGWRYWIPDADPRLARLAADRPRLLFVAGTPDLQAPAVAVVGTRRPDAYGDAMAGALAGALGRAGAVVVSGGALGVDRRAHEAALDAGGRTTVVLGSGLGRPHPASNRPLFERAVDAGSCVVAELPPSVCARAYTFPRRNRLIAALADAVVVVQAGARGPQTAQYLGGAQGMEVGGGGRRHWPSCGAGLLAGAVGGQGADDLYAVDVGLLVSRFDVIDVGLVFGGERGGVDETQAELLRRRFLDADGQAAAGVLFAGLDLEMHPFFDRHGDAVADAGGAEIEFAAQEGVVALEQGAGLEAGQEGQRMVNPLQ